MNFFKKKTAWSNIELAVFKIFVFSAGILAGVFFYNYFRTNCSSLIILCFITAIYTGYLWVNKMISKD